MPPPNWNQPDKLTIEPHGEGENRGIEEIMIRESSYPSDNQQVGKRGLAFACLVLLLAFPIQLFAQQHSSLSWSKLPSLPDTEGFAGMFAGVSHGALIAAGGANFPTARPWEGGTKVWYDSIFILERPDGSWERANETLSHPLAYGVSISAHDRLIVIGGSNADRYFNDTFALEWQDGRIRISQLPPLPFPLANMAGALVGDVIYIAGGTTSPTAVSAGKTFLALDLTAPARQSDWIEMEPWPGPERTQPVAASQGGAFFLFSGYRLKEEVDGAGNSSIVRVLPFLTDGYRFSPERVGGRLSGSWQRIADLPRAAAAAPGPAASPGLSHIIISGGLDSETAKHTDLATYPPFPTDVLTYHMDSDSWVSLGKMPDGSSRVTAPTVFWSDRWIIVSGESKPGIRSPELHTVEVRVIFGGLNWIFLGTYLLVMLGIGIYFSRHEKGTGDFFLAGRRIPWWAAGVSIYGTQLSAITFMALPAIVFSTNWALAVGTLTIVAAAPFVIKFYLPFYRRLNVTTAYEYLEKRFNLPVRLFGSATFILYQLGRMGIVLFLPAIAISAVTGIDVFLCIGIMGVFCTVYTVLGGIEAVIWTDVLQVAVLLGGALLCLGIIAGGVEGGISGIIEMGMDDHKFALYNPGYSPKEFVLWVAIVGFFFLNVTPYTSDQTVVQRYLTTKDEDAARKSIWANAVLGLPAIIIFYGLGTSLYVYYKTNPATIASGNVNEILPWFIVQSLPVGLAGIVIGGIFAATMSSVDSSMNSIATTIINDVYRRFKPHLSDQHFLKTARWITGVIGVVGIASAMHIATFEIRFLYDLFQEVLGLLGGSLTGVFFLAVFTRRANAIGAFAGAITGTALPWFIKHSSIVEVHPYLYGMIGVCTCFAVGLLVSSMTSQQKDLAGLTYRTIGK